jgi:tight adherence protein B
MSEFQAIGLFLGLAVFCVIQGLFLLTRGKRRQHHERLLELLRAREFQADWIDGNWRPPGSKKSWIDRWSKLRRLGVVLAQAGWSISVERFLIVVGIVLLLVGLAVTVVSGNPVSGLTMDLVVVVFIYLFISTRRRKRLNQIDEQLPQALELMVFGLRAGHPLEGALRFVAGELPDPLGGELRRCHEEYELGRPLEAALVSMSLRLDACRALRTFVEAVVVLKQTGGNLVEVMERIVSTLRAQAAYEARYRALTAEGRTSGLILGSLPLLILAAVLIVQPGYLASLFKSGPGRVVFSIAFTLWMLGIAWLMRLVRPAV